MRFVVPPESKEIEFATTPDYASAQSIHQDVRNHALRFPCPGMVLEHSHRKLEVIVAAIDESFRVPHLRRGVRRSSTVAADRIYSPTPALPN